MDSIFSSLIRSEEPAMRYPLFTQSIDPPRVQIHVAPQRFAMVISHPMDRHLCCYALCSKQLWSLIRHEVLTKWALKYRSLAIDYVGHGTDAITWMSPREDGRLTRPSSVGAPFEDYWVGFAMPGTMPHTTDMDHAIRYVLELESLIKEVQNDFITSGQIGDIGRV